MLGGKLMTPSIEFEKSDGEVKNDQRQNEPAAFKGKGFPTTERSIHYIFNNKKVAFGDNFSRSRV